MENKCLWNRPSVLQTLGTGVISSLAASRLTAAAPNEQPYKVRGNIKQSICRWCYGRIPLRTLAAQAVAMGYKSIELLGPDDVRVIRPLGLTCAMLNGAGTIANGLNRRENHERSERELRRAIDFAAEAGLPNVICFSGNRRGMSDDEGLANCEIGLKRIVGYAERKRVTICMELLNSKVDHRDYMCDHTSWGVRLVKRVGSERFRLLYDIYHMQIMEGDVIRTITENKDYIAHYHTGGVPGRHEIDDTQELNYRAIVRAILATGYKGFLGQEFIPAREPLASLAQGLRICDV